MGFSPAGNVAGVTVLTNRLLFKVCIYERGRFVGKQHRAAVGLQAGHGWKLALMVSPEQPELCADVLTTNVSHITSHTFRLQCHINPDTLRFFVTYINTTSRDLSDRCLC